MRKLRNRMRLICYEVHHFLANWHLLRAQECAARGDLKGRQNHAEACDKHHSACSLTCTCGG